MRNFNHFLLSASVLAGIFMLAPTLAARAAEPAQPVSYEADAASYNQLRQVATLSGNVKLQQGPQSLTADEVVYDRVNDVAMAKGNVVFTDKDGSVHKAETLEVSHGMKHGLAQRILSYLPNGGRVKADTAVRLTEKDFKLSKARYTACAPCENDPQDKHPAWQLVADKVTVDDTKKEAVYKNARLKFYGVPILYTPWFKHSTENVKQKSGFLTPKVGYNSNLGAFYEQGYYFALRPDKDATVSVLTSTSEAPVLKTEYRQRFETGQMKLQNSVTRSSRKDTNGTDTISTNKEWRGHFFGNAQYDINDLWRAGAKVQLASDAQYLKQYKIDDTDVLENKIYAERFSGRSYVQAETILFQDVRTGSSKVDQPGIFPHLSLSTLSDPGSVLGGRVALDADFLSLFREGSGQDVYRLSSTASWQRRDILPLGFVFTSEASLRGDVYKTQDRVAAALDPNEANSNTASRLIPTAHFVASYPLEKRLQNASLRVEPEISLTTTSNIENNSKIPNEDSEDAQLDTNNLFEANRFAGYDRVEDKTHVAYGLRTSYYGDTGDQVIVFAGQSRRLSPNGDNPFPTGSGLEQKKSDYVGEATILFDEGKQTLNYKTQYDGETGRSERHEVFFATHFKPFTLGGTYLYARAIPSSTTTNVTREQASLSGSYNLTEAWNVRAGANYNLDSTDRGLRTLAGGVDYNHECYNFSITGEREVARESSGADQFTIMMRFGLKTLGEFSASGG